MNSAWLLATLSEWWQRRPRCWTSASRWPTGAGRQCSDASRIAAAFGLTAPPARGLGFLCTGPRKRRLKSDRVHPVAFTAECAALPTEARATGARIYLATESHFRAHRDWRVGCCLPASSENSNRRSTWGASSPVREKHAAASHPSSRAGGAPRTVSRTASVIAPISEVIIPFQPLGMMADRRATAWQWH